MIDVVFKNLEKSEIVKQSALERLQEVINRFPDLEGCRIILTLSMENSPVQAGPDVFKVKFRCQSGRYKGVILEQSGSNLYIALAETIEGLLERLNRFGDKRRMKKLRAARKNLRELYHLDPPQLSYT